MTMDFKMFAEILGTVAGVIANYSAFQQMAYCVKTRSASGLAWGSLTTRCVAIILFALSTFLYGGPVSMFIGNLFGIVTTLVIVAIKWREARCLKIPSKVRNDSIILNAETLGNKIG